MTHMKDLSFESYETQDASQLLETEQAFADYANGVMQALKQLETLESNAPKGTRVYRFPQGTVEMIDSGVAVEGYHICEPIFTPARAEAGRSIKTSDIADDYPGPVSKGTDRGTLAEGLTVVETSEPLTLTQGRKSDRTASFPVPEDTHLMVLGDIVYIEGQIQAPGKHVVIVARELRTIASVDHKAELNVSAGPLAGSDIPGFPMHGKEGYCGTPAQPKLEVEYDIDLVSRDIVWKGPDGHNKALRDKIPRHIPAQMGTRGFTGENGGIGRTGGAGGDIYILCERLADFSSLTLVSKGGMGGRGQQGQKGGKGGHGGDGFDRLNRRDPFTPFQRGIANPPAEGTSGNSGGDGGLGGAGGVGGPGGNITVVINGPRGEDTAIECQNPPGDSGPLGYGGPGGDRGDPGYNYRTKEPIIDYIDRRGPHFLPASPSPDLVSPNDGDSRLKALQEAGQPLPPDLVTPPGRWGRSLILQNMNGLTWDARRRLRRGANLQEHLKGIVSVSYVHKLIETVRTRYLQWDAYRLGQDDEAEDLKAELEARLNFSALAYDLLPEFLPEYLGPMRGAFTVAINGLTMNLSQQSLDYFGNRSNHVPLGSPDVYVGPFKESLQLLLQRESAYSDFLHNLENVDNAGKVLDKTIAAANESIHKLSKDRNLLHDQLVDLVRNKIPAADTRTEDAKEKLSGTLKHLGKWVKEAFGLTPQDFISCAFNLAFIGDLSPAKVGDKLNPHGAFTAFTTLTSQSATLIDKAINTLPDDEGQPVNRKRLLLRVDNLGKRIQSLNEAWITIQSSQSPTDPKRVALSDPGEYRLLMVQKDFDDMLERFSTFPEVAGAKQDMDDYISAIQTRNSHLLDYNTLVTEYLRVAGEHDTTKAQIGAAQAVRASTAQPNVNSKAAFLLSLYNRTRDRCLRYCYLASRSYYFWTLEPDTSLYRTLKLGNPNEIDYDLLSSVEEDLYDRRTEQIRSALSNTVQAFPPEEADYTGTGMRVIFEKSTSPTEFEALIKYGRATFSIRSPASGDTLRQNPFVSVCNVRIRKVRLWVLGVKSEDGMCGLRIRHNGEEVIQKRDNTLVSFSHEPVSLRFVYDGSHVRWNAERQYVENPDEVLKVGALDGDLRSQPGSAYLPLIGPFADWQVELNEKDHVGLDRSGISTICFEFHGLSQTADDSTSVPRT